jgi:hypothetical protein
VSSVAFTSGGGFDEGSSSTIGRVSFGGASLMLELDTSHGEDDGDRTTRKVLIGIEEFAAVRYKRGLLHDRILLRTASLAALGGVPGALEDMVVLRVARRDRGQAEALVGRLRHVLAEASRPPRSRAATTV